MISTSRPCPGSSTDGYTTSGNTSSFKQSSLFCGCHRRVSWNSGPLERGDSVKLYPLKAHVQPLGPLNLRRLLPILHPFILAWKKWQCGDVIPGDAKRVTSLGCHWFTKMKPTFSVYRSDPRHKFSPCAVA